MARYSPRVALAVALTALVASSLVALPLTAAHPDANAAPAPVVVHALTYDYYCVGRCTTDVATQTSPGALLAGGGTDVDAAMKWFLVQSGGGDILILRASGSDGYNQYLYDLAPVNSVATIVFKTKDASTDSFVLDRIRKSEAIFMAGGDQAVYMQFWANSPVQELLQSHLASGRPIGGTSAGLAVLPQFVYTAEFGTVYSDEALANPYNFRVTLSDKPLVSIPALAMATTDTHFQERDRMGRLVTFMARMMQDYGITVSRSIAVNEATAVALDLRTGLGTVMGSSNAYFLQSNRTPDVCRQLVPLTFVNIDVFKGTGKAGSVFNFNTWTGSSGTNYKLDAVNGVLQSTQSRNQIY
eukprot:TRINITY_DN4970_c0_g1_i1.p1 TRINITY_DN4970_c0_g1~~TRINITY_DN4970_c0_g1_i1.p1  ORF type:complete len:356 (-),score=68.48 TRINITY_DN4970_c0_g1_i1:239-1306(-)